MMAPTS